MAQEGLDARDSLKVFKTLTVQADTVIAALQRELNRKEGVIVKTQLQRNTCYQLTDSLQRINSRLSFANTQADKIINAYQSRGEKRWGLSLVLGAGMTQAEKRLAPGYFLGAGLTCSFLRF